MKYIITAISLLVATQMNGQTWKLNLETGATLSRLLPTTGSTQKTGTLKYGYSKPGMYISPEVQLKINDHLDAGFNYQYASAIIGVQHRSHNSSIYNYEGIDMHSFSLSLNAHRSIFKGQMKAGAFVKTGFSHNHMVMTGGGGSSVGGDMSGQLTGTPSYSSITRTSGFEVMSGAWTPTSTIGLSIGTNSKKWIADRLSLNVAATMNWKNTYNDYSFYDYDISTANGSESGRVQYQGIPFVLQFGVKYRIAGFGGKD